MLSCALTVYCPRRKFRQLTIRTHARALSSSVAGMVVHSEERTHLPFAGGGDTGFTTGGGGGGGGAGFATGGGNEAGGSYCGFRI